ncbi:hypothetical protein BDZ89DRAFT_1036922 [Hymenopellis radicata]|nr:hypothetical protein BDZ89DRAFT_1036922 [Hymenopellis radicata]
MNWISTSNARRRRGASSLQPCHNLTRVHGLLARTISSPPPYPHHHLLMHLVEPRFLLLQVAGASPMHIVHVDNPRAIARGRRRARTVGTASLLLTGTGTPATRFVPEGRIAGYPYPMRGIKDTHGSPHTPLVQDVSFSEAPTPSSRAVVRQTDDSLDDSEHWDRLGLSLLVSSCDVSNELQDLFSHEKQETDAMFLIPQRPHLHSPGKNCATSLHKQNMNIQARRPPWQVGKHFILTSLSLVINSSVGSPVASIAERMVPRARIQSWDNLARGLDASTAPDFVKSLHTIIMTNLFGQTTFVSLYQAGEGIHELYDKVLVLCEGRQRTEKTDSEACGAAVVVDKKKDVSKKSPYTLGLTGQVRAGEIRVSESDASQVPARDELHVVHGFGGVNGWKVTCLHDTKRYCTLRVMQDLAYGHRTPLTTLMSMKHYAQWSVGRDISAFKKVPTDLWPPVQRTYFSNTDL